MKVSSHRVERARVIVRVSKGEVGLVEGGIQPGPSKRYNRLDVSPSRSPIPHGITVWEAHDKEAERREEREEGRGKREERREKRGERREASKGEETMIGEGSRSRTI
jgi:hypothetical protein